MSRRLAFLTGHLSGLLLGALLVFILLAARSDRRPVLNLAPGKPMPIQVGIPAAPNGWELRHFNGRAYYIVPVALGGWIDNHRDVDAL